MSDFIYPEPVDPGFTYLSLPLFSIQSFPSNHPALWVNMLDGRSRLVSAAWLLSVSDLLFSSHMLCCGWSFPVHHALLSYLKLWAGPVITLPVPARSPHYWTNCEDLANCSSWYLQNELAFFCMCTVQLKQDESNIQLISPWGSHMAFVFYGFVFPKTQHLWGVNISA